MHHLPADWLVAYANGSLAPAECVLVATHLTLCPTCRAVQAMAETAASGALTQATPVPLDPGGLDGLLARLDLPEEAPAARPVHAPASGLLVPRPVLDLLDRPFEALPWRWLAPFVRGVDLPVPTDGLPLRLVEMSAGAHMPHRHAGNEAGVILQGGWTDQLGHFGRGDVAISTPELGVHDQRIDLGVSCIALVLNDAPAIPANPVAALFARWFFQI